MEPNHISDKISGLEIDQTSRDHLKTTITWARIVAIIGIVNAGLGLVRVIVGPASVNRSSYIGAIMFSLFWAVTMFVLYTFLLRFAARTATALNTENQERFAAGIDNLRTYFKIIGIIIITVMSLIALLILFFQLARGLK